MKKSLKILHAVEFYYPSIGGAQEVVRHLSERMVQAGHDVTIATTKLPNRKDLIHNGVKIVEFELSGNSVNGIKGNQKPYVDLLKNGGFDIIMTYAAQQWSTDIFLENLDDIKAAKVLVPCGYSALYDPAYEEFFKSMPGWLKKVDAAVYLSNDYRDINFAREHGLNNSYVIPNGADETEFTDTLNNEQKSLMRNMYGIGGLVIMTIGNYTGEKGHLELLNIFKKLPVSKATLVSAGTLKPHDGCFDEFERQAAAINNGRRYIGKRVVMLDGTDRRLVRDMLKSADMFVFLSNIEASPLVIFESAAAGVPFVATAAGNISELSEWLGSGIVVKTEQRPNGRVKADMKDALWQITKLAHNKQRRVALGQKGRNTWKKNYTWDKLTQDYLDLYNKVLKSKGANK
ncbi:glycosyltransferase family 4 protein [Candidatus Saccharibacteria bacterium]|nr:glycosyltransferase family 4 protein [Candidatus Saccharibacteria bacterium]